MRVVQFQRSEMTNLVAELTHGVAHRVHAIHQLAVAGIGIDERLYCVADEGEVANIAPVVVYRARLLVKQIEQQSSLSGVRAIHVMQADTSRSRAVGFSELLVEVLRHAVHRSCVAGVGGAAGRIDQFHSIAAASGGHHHERMNILPLDVVESVVEHARLGCEMKHHVSAAVGEQRLDAGGVTANLRVDADNIELRCKSSAEGFANETLAAGYYCSQCRR